MSVHFVERPLLEEARNTRVNIYLKVDKTFQMYIQDLLKGPTAYQSFENPMKKVGASFVWLQSLTINICAKIIVVENYMLGE